MFPNPQAALPLPPRPNLEQYRKLAKDLVKACKSDEIHSWARMWIESLTAWQARAPRLQQLDRYTDDVEQFAMRTLTTDRGCVLAQAQFVIARSHGFESWPKFVRHLDALEHGSSAEARYEQAADAIVTGGEETLRQLLASDPSLVHRRSTREHHAILLHYVSANGVEGYRQRSPTNAPAIARILLDAGSEVDTAADVYRGHCTTLLLVATSTPPRQAGVQIPLMELLIEHAARIDQGPHARSMVIDALANGCPEAAEYLASRGAPLDMASASALGRVDVIASHFDADGTLKGDATQAQVQQAFFSACGYGQNHVVEFLLKNGASVSAQNSDGQTGAHCAGIGGKANTMRLLVARGAPLEVKNRFGGTVLGQALWSAAHGGNPDVYEQIIKTLIGAGAFLPDRHVPVNDRIDALLLRHGSRPEPKWAWYGEKPRES